jgi:hypothetical protein
MTLSLNKFLRPNELKPFLDGHGFVLSNSTLSKLCAVGKGPPVAYWWGNRAPHDPGAALEWPRARVRPGERLVVAQPKDEGAA